MPRPTGVSRALPSSGPPAGGVGSHPRGARGLRLRGLQHLSILGPACGRRARVRFGPDTRVIEPSLNHSGHNIEPIWAQHVLRAHHRFPPPALQARALDRPLVAPPVSRCPNPARQGPQGG